MDDRKRFKSEVESQERRLARVRTRGTRSVWTGLGTIGVVGWSIVAPTVVGVEVGLWLDRHRPEQRSWTLTLLIAGLTLGCFLAWRWVSREAREIREEEQ